MHRYVSRANVDHFITLLHGTTLSAQHRSTTTTLLLGEFDRLSEDINHLEFAESKVSDGHAHVLRVRRLRDSLMVGTPEREEAERQLIHAENLLTLLDDFCHRLRSKAKPRPK